jgi:nucleoside-diphosphate-sugar epimerase
MRVIVTGASGFVGSALGRAIKSKDGVDSVIGLVREEKAGLGFATRTAGNLFEDGNWRECLDGADVVIHLAARAHVLNDGHEDPLTEFRRVNVDGSLRVAEAALKAGVKRFVFVSSIGVNGNQTLTSPFNELTPPAPVSDYAVSKWEAEQALSRFFSGTGVELVTVRPPLVYAGHAPGNFQRLMWLVAKGLPLPFGAVDNQRSMIALENLVDFLMCCARHPDASGETFLVSDGEDCSLSEILALLAQGMRKRLVQLPFPLVLLQGVARLFGKRALVDQLCGSLQVDSNKSRELLGWQPKVSARDALIDSGRSYARLVSKQSKL